MRAFKTSIKQKLILIILCTSGITLLLASVAFVTISIISLRESLIKDLSTLAKVVGINSEGALVFDDRFTAERHLSAFRANNGIVYACIYRTDGTVFASYAAPEGGGRITPPKIRESSHYFEGDYLFLFQEIVIESEVIGTVFIQHGLNEIRGQLARYIAIVCFIILVAFLVALMLSSLLQGIISVPILNLARTARLISQNKDYSVRAEKFQRDDEIGVLIDGFNEMLTEIQSQQGELKEHREHLEELVVKRTQALRESVTAFKKAKEAAETANRAKSEFLANMSHEIRTPMNAVLGFTDLLYSMINDDKQKSYLDAIKSSGKSLLTLINDILDLSKIEAKKMDLQYEPVNIATVFDEIKDIFSLKIKDKGIKFITEIGPEVPDNLLLDEVRLRQILFNLMGNAVKFTVSGHIRLFAKRRVRPENDEKLDILMAVEDTGIGIPPESRETIFDAFKQQDGQSTKQYGGTGLGLTITKRLVEMMGGRITVTSEVGKGSTFEVIFHGVAFEARPVEPKTYSPPRRSDIIFEPSTVLVVDDIKANRNLVKAYLQDTPIRCLEASNGAEAVSLAKKEKPDIILMDIRMPVMDGCDATQMIRRDEISRNIPIIALTASSMRSEQEKIRKCGFDGLLIKPFKREDLVRRLSHFIQVDTSGASEDPSREDAMEKSEIHVDETISAAVLAGLPHLIEALEGEYRKLWEKARSNGFFEDIGTFAKEIQKAGETYQLDLLRQFGKTLDLQVSSFDIEKINATMDTYPNLIQVIKTLYRRNAEESGDV
ncbi:ATP-binding protein [Desulfococcus sp.]|uniref:ATP-binding protein n=1 Tax=Desulfococcus sp. TaxID=2025834 RepID=UPI0035943785